MLRTHSEQIDICVNRPVRVRSAGPNMMPTPAGYLDVSDWMAEIQRQRSLVVRVRSAGPNMMPPPAANTDLHLLMEGQTLGGSGAEDIFLG
ncbi:hypothetical protein ACOMHN_061729 [Nucella lapillus]